MKIVGLGVPSQFTAWGFDVLKRLVAAAGAGGPVTYVDRFDAIQPLEGVTRTLLAQYPSLDLIALAGDDDLAATVFHVPGLSSVRFLLANHRCTFMDALRGASASAALIGSFARQGRVLVVGERDADDPAALVTRLAAHHGLDLPPAKLAAVVKAAGRVPAPKAPVTEPDEDQLTIVAQVLDRAFAHLADPAVQPVSAWPYRIFLSGDRPNEAAGLVTEVTGASRVMYYGPYLHLQQGRWRARFTLGFSETAIGLPFSLQAHTGDKPLGEARVLPRRPGIFAAEFGFDVAQPAQPIEFRIMSVEGAIEGRFALAQIELTPTEPAAAAGRVAAPALTG